MKESKFIELLNLYIDRQISPEESALLEEEILQNPRHRETYRRYCRMHRACTIVLERYEAQNALADAERKVVSLAAPRRLKWGYYAAGLAAACMALVAMQTFSRSGGASTSPLATTGHPQPSMERSEVATVLAPARPTAPNPRTISKTEDYIAQQLRLVSPIAVSPDRVSPAASDHRIARNSPSPAPVLRAKTPTSIEEFVFENNPATPENTHIFRARQSDTGAEMNAIEYQRQ